MTKPTDCMWKPVDGFEMYEVSDSGHVWSKRRQRLLTPNKRSDGYMSVVLHNSPQKRFAFVHRLVAEAFIPPVSGKQFVDHINGIKADNVSSNLRWCTKSENSTFDACRRKRRITLCSERHLEKMYRSGRAMKVRCVETGEEFKTLRQAASSYDINPSCICVAIKTGLRSCGYRLERA